VSWAEKALPCFVSFPIHYLNCLTLRAFIIDKILNFFSYIPVIDLFDVTMSMLSIAGDAFIQRCALKSCGLVAIMAANSSETMPCSRVSQAPLGFPSEILELTLF